MVADHQGGRHQRAGTINAFCGSSPIPVELLTRPNSMPGLTISASGVPVGCWVESFWLTPELVGLVHALLCCGTERRLRHPVLSPNTFRWRAVRNLGWLRLSCAAAGGDGRMHLAGLPPQNRCSRGAARGEASAAASSKTKIPVGNGRQDGEVNACGRKACKTIVPSDARPRRSFRRKGRVLEDDPPVRPVRPTVYSNDDDHSGDEDGRACIGPALRNVRFHPE
jgi:hypothetical protein